MKSFSLLSPKLVTGLFFSPKPVRLGFKKQNPNPKHYSKTKSAAAGVAHLLRQVQDSFPFLKRGWKSGFKEEDQNRTIEHKLTKLARALKLVFTCGVVRRAGY